MVKDLVEIKRKNLYGSLILEIIALFFMGYHIGAKEGTSDSLSFIFLMFFWVAGILVLLAGLFLNKNDEL